jgi:uncharacterized protein
MKNVRIVTSAAEIGAAAWNRCANPEGRSDPHPFTRYEFFLALEKSRSAAASTGWQPCHLVLGNDEAILPIFLKDHSQGEYVFDHAWADAYERAGGSYYPKLQCCSPFSPVTGPRLLARPGPDGEAAQSLILAGALALCERTGASGLHVTFATEAEWRLMGEQGLLRRQDQQYHWINQGYRTFDDFLAALSSGRRKTIRRERRDALAEVEAVALTGAELTEAHWDAFFGFYMDTGSRKWGRPYLNRQFFSMFSERMADRILLILARKGGRWIAGALNLIGADCLYGRHWGCVEDVPFLHFELCYYQAIEHAIRLGLPRVEAGAQGQHKIARGYRPTAVYSAHYIADPALRVPVARYLEQERQAVRQEMDWLAEEYSPFREGVEG